MRRSHLIAWVFLAALLILGSLSWLFYDRLPWVGAHFVHRDPATSTRWSVNLQVQQGHALGNKASLEEVPTPSREASMKGTMIQQGQPAGQEWNQQLRIESLESIQYSWEQKDNKEILKSLWEARIGPAGGLRGLEIKPEGRSLWLHQELASAWLLTLWPQFVTRGLEPKQSWNSQVPFKIRSRELTSAVDAHWDCTWTYRGNSTEAALPLAIIDLKATASAQSAPLDGTLRAEIAYSLPTQQVAATRGSFQVRYAIPTQATEQSTVVLLQCLQGQFQALRLVKDEGKPR